MKKMLAPALALVCLLSLSVSAFAATQRAATEEMAPCAADGGHSHEKVSLLEPDPAAAVCPGCGEFSFIPSLSYSTWVSNESTWRDCPTNPAYRDREQMRIVTTTTVCENCGYGTIVSQEEFRWYCVNRRYAHPN